MFNRKRNITLGFVICTLAATLEGQSTGVPPCPGYNPANNINLACELATSFRAAGTKFAVSTGTVSAALGTQLGNLPIATAISGSGIVLTGPLAVRSQDSLGTILTERGETVGKHHIFFSLNYQRFDFGSVDGIRFKSFNTVAQQNFTNSQTGQLLGSEYTTAQNRVDMHIDQFTALGTFGITNNLDLTLIVPFSKVTLTTGSSALVYFAGSNGQSLGPPSTAPTLYFPGSIWGPGDVAINVKANVYKSSSEKTAIAVGSELRLPTGDETNYLGTGAYGVKPYFIASHHGKLITPNVNLGYQWNSSSSLYYDQTTGDHLNLPASFTYSGGADFRITSRFTLVGEFVGQYVINGPRVVTTQFTVPGAPGNSVTAINSTSSSGQILTSSYGIDNAGAGFKFSPFPGLSISASAMFKLDDGGLRAKVTPLVGVSYRF